MPQVACCQIVPDVEDPVASAARAREAVRAAVDAGAQIVVLPELVHSGYVFGSAAEVRAAAVPAEEEPHLYQQATDGASGIRRSRARA